jgi:hypothetical protein
MWALYVILVMNNIGEIVGLKLLQASRILKSVFVAVNITQYDKTLNFRQCQS